LLRKVRIARVLAAQAGHGSRGLLDRVFQREDENELTFLQEVDDLLARACPENT
jgi:hypothetical protein